MKKRNILIIVLIVLILGMVGFNIYLNSNKVDYDYGSATVVKNDLVKKTHCTENLCFHGMELSYLGPTYVYFAGYVENRTSENYDGKVEFVFETENGNIVLGSGVKLEPFQKKIFEAGYVEPKILDTIDYTFREVN